MTMNWLLFFIPVTIGLEFLAPERHLLVFLASSFAVLPLAASMGRATEQLAEQMGEGVGGLRAHWRTGPGRKNPCKMNNRNPGPKRNLGPGFLRWTLGE